MARYVIGDDGEVIGEMDDDDVDGVGAAPLRLLKAPATRPVRMHVPPRPAWRRPAMAPGIPAAGYGKEILPMTADNGGLFDATHPLLNFRGFPQKAFQPLRMIVTFAKSAGVASILTAISFFVGASNVLVAVSGFSVEPYTNQGLDLGIKLPACAQGQIIQLAVAANPPLAGADTMALDMQFLGHTVHG